MTKIAVGTEVTWNRFSSLDKPMQGKVVAVDSLLRLAKVEGTPGWVPLSAIKPVDA